jgi:acyl carrier protein
MDIQVLITEIALALEISESEITPESDSSMIEEWDSLGHISILARLDQTFDNITEKLPDLASALSVSEMHKLLTGGGL